jgi:hypothetical protein
MIPFTPEDDSRAVGRFRDLLSEGADGRAPTLNDDGIATWKIQ